MNNLKHPVTSKPQYLEVKTPKTTDGITLAYDANRQPIFKTTNLPLGARKRLEQKNTRLPTHLRHIITVKTNQPAAQQTEPALQQPAQDPPKNKGGRPAKTQTNETK